MTTREPLVPPVPPKSGVPAPGTRLRTGAALASVFERLADSAAGLQRAAQLVDDDALAGALAEMAERRQKARAQLMIAADEAGMEPPDSASGTVTGALRRGWMRLQSRVGGDEQVIDAAVAEEDRLIQDCGELLDSSLPTEVAAALRTTRTEVEAGKALLRSWQEA